MHKTADEMRISDWSSDVCSSDLASALALYYDTDGAMEGRNAFIEKRRPDFGKFAKGSSDGLLGSGNPAANLVVVSKKRNGETVQRRFSSLDEGSAGGPKGTPVDLGAVRCPSLEPGIFR